MKKAKDQTCTSKLRIIMSRHGEGLHNVAWVKINQIWKDKERQMREQITSEFGNTSEINEILNTIIEENKNEIDSIAYNLVEAVDSKKYKDPSLTEKGMVQASYSGKSLQEYVDKNNLQLSSLVFSSPLARTIESLEQVLPNLELLELERFAIPDFMETSGFYVSTYDEHKDYGEYKVLDEGIDVQVVMKGEETEEQEVERLKRGLEKVFRKLKGKEEGLPIVMIHGGVMKVFSDKFFKGEVGKIENSDLWNLELSFNESGKLAGAKFIQKVEMDAALKKEYDEKLDSLEPSEKLLDKQDFSPIEEALSTFKNRLKEEAKKRISGKQKAHIDSSQGQPLDISRNNEPTKDLSALAASSRATTTTTTTTTTKRLKERREKKGAYKE